MVKKGNFNRAPLGCFFQKSIDIGIQISYSRLNSTSSVSIFQMTLTSLPAHVPKCIVVRPAFSPLGIIIGLEGCVVPDNVQAAFTRAYRKNTRATFGHPCCLSLKVTRLINRRIQACKSKQLVWIGESGEYRLFHQGIIPPIDITDTRNGHDDRIVKFPPISVISASIFSNWLSSNFRFVEWFF